MRFPPKSYNKELESAEDRREREAQVDYISNYMIISCYQVTTQCPIIFSYHFFQDLELAKEMAEEDDDAY